MNEYISNQARQEVVPPKPDALVQAMQQSDITGTDIINEGFGDNIVVQADNGGSPNNRPPPVYNTVGAASISLELDHNAIGVMKNELAAAHETIAKLKADLARERSRNLQLENQVSSGMYILLMFMVSQRSRIIPPIYPSIHGLG